MNQRPQLTPAEDRARRAIVRLAKRNKYVNPSHAEVAEELDITQWAATKLITQLVRKGYAINPSRQKRSLQLLEIA